MIGTGLYREKQWKSFRLYTFISVLIMFIFGVLSAIVIMYGIELMGLLSPSLWPGARPDVLCPALWFGEWQAL